MKNRILLGVFGARRWSPEANQHGLPGTLVAEGKRGPGQGNHSSLSRGRIPDDAAGGR